MGTTRAPPWHVHQTRLQDRSARSDDYLSGGGGRAVRTGRHRPVRSGGMRGVRASLEVHTSRFRNGKDCIHCRRRIPPAEVSQTPTDWSRSCHAPTTHRRRAFARTHRSPQGTPRALLRCTQKSVRPPAFGCDSKSRGHSTIAARGCVTHCNHDRINMFGALALYSSRKAERPHARLAAEVLENVVSGGHKESNIDWGALADDVAQVLDLAESDESIGDARLSRLEWFFLPLTKHHRSAQKLQQALSTDPAFFLEIIKLVFKPRNGEPRQLSDEEIARAQYGYGLLMEWKRIPGSSREGAIDKAKLKDWVNVAREMAEQADRREIADVKIGEVLSNSPTGEDGLWPHEAIREVIDEATSEELESGIRVGVHNNRGVTTRAIGEGGKQERQIGERYRQYARAFSDQWPRASRLMTSIAESYSDDA